MLLRFGLLFKLDRSGKHCILPFISHIIVYRILLYLEAGRGNNYCSLGIYPLAYSAVYRVYYK